MKRGEPGWKRPTVQINDPEQVARRKCDPESYLCGACGYPLTRGGCDCDSMWGHHSGCNSRRRYCDRAGCEQREAD